MAWEAIIASGLVGLIAGVVVEHFRKISSLHLDADRGVTFIGGEHYVFKRYVAEQDPPENQREAEYFEDGSRNDWCKMS